MHAADGGKDIARRAAELCGVALTLLDDEQRPRDEFYSADGTPTGWCFEYASGFHDGYACVIFQGEEYLLDIALRRGTFFSQGVLL